METYETLSKAIQALKKNGYEYDFNLHPDAIECTDVSQKFAPSDFHVDAVYRFEGMTNPDDNSVLYAISARTGLKGLLLDAYGAYSDSLTAEMVKKLTIDERTQP